MAPTKEAETMYYDSENSDDYIDPSLLAISEPHGQPEQHAALGSEQGSPNVNPSVNTTTQAPTRPRRQANTSALPVHTGPSNQPPDTMTDQSITYSDTEEGEAFIDFEDDTTAHDVSMNSQNFNTGNQDTESEFGGATAVGHSGPNTPTSQALQNPSPPTTTQRPEYPPFGPSPTPFGGNRQHFAQNALQNLTYNPRHLSSQLQQAVGMGNRFIGHGTNHMNMQLAAHNQQMTTRSEQHAPSNPYHPHFPFPTTYPLGNAQNLDHTGLGLVNRRRDDSGLPANLQRAPNSNYPELNSQGAIPHDLHTPSTSARPNRPTVTPGRHPLEDYHLRFNSIDEAEAFRFDHNHAAYDNSTMRNDPTLPHPMDDRRHAQLVADLLAAFYSTDIAEDNDKVIQAWETDGTYSSRVNVELAEIACWKLLRAIMSAQEAPRMARWQPINPNSARYRMQSFQDRFNQVLNALRSSKSICKRFLNPDYMDQFVDDPEGCLGRVTANRKLNGRKGQIMKAGKSVIEQTTTPPDQESDDDEEASPRKKVRKAPNTRRTTSTASASAIANNSPRRQSLRSRQTPARLGLRSSTNTVMMQPHAGNAIGFGNTGTQGHLAQQQFGGLPSFNSMGEQAARPTYSQDYFSSLPANNGYIGYTPPQPATQRPESDAWERYQADIRAPHLPYAERDAEEARQKKEQEEEEKKKMMKMKK